MHEVADPPRKALILIKPTAPQAAFCLGRFAVLTLNFHDSEKIFRPPPKGDFAGFYGPGKVPKVQYLQGFFGLWNAAGRDIQDIVLHAIAGTTYREFPKKVLDRISKWHTMEI